jgi:hypothetical protein
MGRRVMNTLIIFYLVLSIVLILAGLAVLRSDKKHKTDKYSARNNFEVDIGKDNKGKGE